MEKLISVEDLIKQAEKRKIDLGKGDPYNRLRYFTKIGWIPHMTRKGVKDGSAIGHYPAWVLTRLENINELKNQGFSNEEITKKIGASEKKRTIFTTIKDTETKKKVLTYAPIIILMFILAVEWGIIPVGKLKTQFISPALTTPQANASETTKQLVDSGKQFIPTSTRKQIFVKTDKITALSSVNVTFETDYAPATRYWIAYIVPGQGFFVELDAPIQNEAQFSWWITE